MQVQELLERIKREQDTFPLAQKQVAAYIVENYYQLPFLSITTLAKKIGVSDSTIIKFCNQMGFDKFAEFKKVFSDFVHSELVMYNNFSLSSLNDTDEESAFTRVMEQETNNIRTTLSNPVNQENLPVLHTMLQEARTIYVTGGRSSAWLASYFAGLLRFLGLKVFDINTGTGDYLDRMSMAGPEDLVIALCFPRYTRLVVDTLRDLSQDNIPVVLLTDTGLSPAYPFAKLVFHCNVTSDTYFPFNSSCMSLINAICYVAGLSQKTKASEHIRRLEKRLLEKDVFL